MEWTLDPDAQFGAVESPKSGSALDTRPSKIEHLNYPAHARPLQPDQGRGASASTSRTAKREEKALIRYGLWQCSLRRQSSPQWPIAQFTVEKSYLDRAFGNQRVSFVVIKRPVISGGAALARGFEG
jgi:hypothetical protein